jgi:protein-tyrosine phosphatase
VSGGGAVRPYRVCFVCTGNICRSPMAEVVLRERLAEIGLGLEPVRVESAGTGSWHVGDGINPAAGAALRRRGYAGFRHAARRFDAGWLAELDLAVALDRTHLRAMEAMARGGGGAEIRLLRSFEPNGGTGYGGLDVPDPYGGSADEFDECLAMIESACVPLAEEVAQRVRTVRSGP